MLTGTERERPSNGRSSFLRLIGWGLILALWITNAAVAPFVPANGSADAWLKSPLADDAYYYLAVARNVAHGEGSTIHGAPVNGYQPLFLGVTLAAGEAAGWDLEGTPRAVTVVCFAIENVLGLALILTLVRQLVSPERRPAATFFTAAFYLGHSALQRFALVGLETPLSLVAWLACFVMIARVPSAEAMDAKTSLTLGALFGFGFLARNDFVVFPVAYGIVQMVAAYREARVAAIGHAARRLATMAATMTLVCSPWLAFNWVRFGHLVPQGGRAEGFGFGFDLFRESMLLGAARALPRNTLPMAVPLDRMPNFAAVVTSVLVVVICVAAAWLTVTKALNRDARRLMQTGALACAFLVITYIGAFSADWMLTRWLAPISLLSVILTAIAAERLWSSGLKTRKLVTAIVLSLTIATRLATAWVDRNRVIVTNTYPTVEFLRTNGPFSKPALFQSGLPQWVDPDVYNLDGKLNADALEARLEGRLADYILQEDFDLVAEYETLLGLELDPRISARYRFDRQPSGLLTLTSRK